MSDTPAVVVVSGHMVDTPDRSGPPRFPPKQVDRVSDEVAHVMSEWGVGPGTTIVSGGARGADIIVAEAGVARGATVKLCLALPPNEFERRSVALPDSDWSARFRALLQIADVETVSKQDSPDDDGEVFAQANRRLIEVARVIDPTPHAVLVWNGEGGDGAGGTRDFVRQLGYDAPNRRVCVIDPTPRDYEARQTTPGPKKLLALDGGGIRGVLCLEILKSIETQLREVEGKSVGLSDYFDYFGGTSTGAIIATALALGRPVDDVLDEYQTLARRVFTKRLIPMRLRSIYRDSGLTAQLDSFLGRGRSLGDADFKSLLALVLHNTVTDSPWPLSNCTQAKYNRADRNLLPVPDRNLDLSLTTLVRGSTAAPVYFSPQELRVGARDFLFQDGGLTPFNNPAMMLVLLATLPEYGLRWPVGEQNMLVVSVGTGSAAGTHPGLKANKVTLLFTAQNLPSVFMRGASVGQDLICRALGTTKAGAEIDREVGSRVNRSAISTPSLFSYVRYDADLSDEALIRHGIRSRRTRQRVRKLDAVDEMGSLRDIGKRVGSDVDVLQHFRGFLGHDDAKSSR